MVEDLCILLADRIQMHNDGNDRPAVNERWRRDMRLLLTRGPLGTEHEQLTPEQVQVAICAVFNELATPDAGGFCWADQVRSPGALRKHFPKLRLAVKRVRNPPQSRSNAYGEAAVLRQLDIINGRLQP